MAPTQPRMSRPCRALHSNINLWQQVAQTSMALVFIQRPSVAAMCPTQQWKDSRPRHSSAVARHHLRLNYPLPSKKSKEVNLTKSALVLFVRLTFIFLIFLYGRLRASDSPHQLHRPQADGVL